MASLFSIVRHDFDLDISPGHIPPTVNVTETDVGCFYRAHLYDNGTPVTSWYLENCFAKIEGNIYEYGFSIDANIIPYPSKSSIIEFKLTEAMTAVRGRVWTKIRIYDEKENQSSTCGFWLVVDRPGLSVNNMRTAKGFKTLLSEIFTAWIEKHGTAPIGSGVNSVNGKSGIVSLKQTDIPNDTGFDVVETYTDLLDTTAAFVHVLDMEDGLFGMPGDCWFERSTVAYDDNPDHPGYETDTLPLRKDGSIMVAMPDQAPLPPSNAPIISLGDCIASYIAHPDLAYGSLYTLFDSIVQKVDSYYNIDCSAFVQACISGITYEKSRYILGTDKENIYGEYVGNSYLPSNVPGRRSHALSTYRLAEWFAEHKRLFRLNSTYDVKEVARKLRFGDVLFCGHPEDSDYKSRPYGIEHCVIVLKTFDNGSILVAQAGGSPTNVTNVSGNQVCKLSVINLVNNDPTSESYGTKYYGHGKYYQVFARPNYRSLFELPYSIGTSFIVNPQDAYTDNLRRITTIKTEKTLNVGESYTLLLKGTLPNHTNGHSLFLRGMYYGSSTRPINGRNIAVLVQCPFEDYIAIPFVVDSRGQIDGIALLDYAKDTAQTDGLFETFEITQVALIRGTDIGLNAIPELFKA